MGRFRVLFGVLLFSAVLADPPLPQPLELHRNYSWLADWPWVHALAASAAACRVVHITTLTAIVFFTVGLLTRPAYLVGIAGILISRLITLQQSGTHDWDLPLLTLIALTLVPWGDGFSLDRYLSRAARDESRPGSSYGMAIWLPGLTLGLALAAAAYAKLANGGIAWVLSGAVRYHFVEDASNAPVSWGLWVAANPLVAVLLSLGAVLIEAGFIANIFVRSAWLRLAFGGVGLLLFGGLYLFQGVFWLPWVMLLSAFLPWPLLDRADAMRPPAGAALRLRHQIAIAVLMLQQVAASATATEVEPLISNYSMYSSTYESPEAFERVRYRKFQQLVFTSSGVDVTAGINGIQNAPEHLLNAAEQLARGERLDEDLIPVLTGIRRQFRTGAGVDLSRVTVDAERTGFDWHKGAFKPAARVTIGDVPLPDADQNE